jgi:hypothetical protein
LLAVPVDLVAASQRGETVCTIDGMAMMRRKPQ